MPLAAGSCLSLQVFSPAVEISFLDRLPRHLATAVLRLVCSGHHFRVETNWWKRIPRERRICRLCDVIEDEMNALFESPCCQHRRNVVEERLLNSQSDKTLENIMVQAISNRPSEGEANQKILNCVANLVGVILKDAWCASKAIWY